MTAKKSVEPPVVFDFDFDEAMARVVQTNPKELSSLVQASITEDTIEKLIDRFEDAGHDNGHGDKCWFARDLQSLLGYKKWEDFEGVIRRAEASCRNSGHDPADHFKEVFPSTRKNSEGGRPSKNYELSRYACYLVAQNASARLKPVAFAQTYFAIQTRRQELADKNGVDFSALSSTHQRLYLRNQIVEENKKLASTAKGAGVEDKYFGKFQNRGYQGLYGGRGVDEIRAHKGLPANAKILDHADGREAAER
jgi:hypothetical protein